MALLNEDLSVWEIGFRWAGLDPDRYWWRIPLPVRDNFRILVDAIWHAHLESNISMEKRGPGHEHVPPEFFIRHHVDAINNCVRGKRYPRMLLQFMRVERWSFHIWCQRRNIPLPEFWFPPSWNIDYQWPDNDEPEPSNSAESIEEQRVRLAKWHRIQMACQQVALSIWAKEPNLTIKEVAWRKEIQGLAGGSEAELETVEGWISKVDRRDPSKKRGRKRKNNPGPGDTGE